MSALLALLLAGSSVLAPPPDEDPRLVVLVVVDQLTPDQLERLAPLLTGGLRRYLDGEVWWRAAHRHAATETAPGHASLSTGCHPARHGVVGNGWTAPDGTPVYCVGDPDASLLGPAGPRPGSAGRSPAHLLVPGIADHVKAADPASRAVGIAGKDRAAIPSTGREAELVLWWDRSLPGFTSSSWYAPALPEWVAEWNAGWFERTAGTVWESTLPDGIERTGTAPDDRPGETGATGRTFPHPAPTTEAELAAWVYGSPWVDAFVLELAERAVDELELGADDHVDYLFVGLSGCDTVGHAFGPTSREVTDLLLRADRGLGRLFAHLDERVGADRWMAALASDHGVLPLPETLRARGVPAGRHSLLEVAARVEELRTDLLAVHGTDYLLGLSSAGLRFDDARMAADGVDAREVHAFAAEVLAEVAWVERAFTAEELAAGPAGDADDPLLELAVRSYHPERSADVVLVPRPWQIATPLGTSHGSPWVYDRAVPLAFFGPGIARRDRREPCATVDLLPTLLERAGLPVPEGLDGKVLR